MFQQEPLVSVICMSYNHEPYIGDALEGILMQKTEYSFEVLVHDDASSDATGDIIMRYADNHPEVIIPIIQKENQFSKGRSITHDVLLPSVRGKYIALCEGDDYWIDEQKLQLQISFMESHPECSMSVHAHRRIDGCSGKALSTVRIMDGDGFIPSEEIIKKTMFPQLCTFVMRTECVKSLPEFFFRAPVGDVPYTAGMSALGSVYYFSRVMADYRVLAPGSWTHRHAHRSLKEKMQHRSKMSRFYDQYDRFTDYKFHTCVEYCKAQYSFENAIDQKRLKEAMNSDYYAQLCAKEKALTVARYYYPDLPVFNRIRVAIREWRK